MLQSLNIYRLHYFLVHRSVEIDSYMFKYKKKIRTIYTLDYTSQKALYFTEMVFV